MAEDKKLIVLILSNTHQNTELFRVHIHEESIRFDVNFEAGIKNHPELSKEIDVVNELYRTQRLSPQQIYHYMLGLMVRYGDYLQDYYFEEFELDKNGAYIESIGQNRDESFFSYLRKNKKIRKIAKKTFEGFLTNIELGEQYVEKYVYKGARFYQYINSKKVHPKNELFMEVSGELKWHLSLPIKESL